MIKKNLLYNSRDAYINIQKIGRIQTKNRKVFKITCNFNGTKLAKNREVAKFGVKMDKNGFKNMEPPSEIGRVGISVIVELCFLPLPNTSQHKTTTKRYPISRMEVMPLHAHQPFNLSLFY